MTKYMVFTMIKIILVQKLTINHLCKPFSVILFSFLVIYRANRFRNILCYQNKHEIRAFLTNGSTLSNPFTQVSLVATWTASRKKTRSLLIEIVQ